MVTKLKDAEKKLRKTPDLNKNAQLIDELIRLEPIKIWSLIVTLLGDLKGQPVSGKELGTIMNEMGIKPETMRVALHRLKKDGWITASKTGREATYGLSDRGVTETQAVYKDVYRRDVKYPAGWQFLLLETDEPSIAENGAGIRLSRNLVLMPVGEGVTDPSTLSLSFDRNAIPLWLSERIVPAQTLALGERLAELAIKVDETNGPHLERAVLRLLFLHRWRKLALRQSSWAHISLFPNGPLALCHKRTTSLIAGLAQLKLEQLQA